MRSVPRALARPTGCSCRRTVTISGTVHRFSQNNGVDADDRCMTTPAGRLRQQIYEPPTKRALNVEPKTGQTSAVSAAFKA